MTEEVTSSPIFRTDEQWRESFKKQRRERLQDSVSEYMDDGEISQFYEDLKYAFQDLIDYHDKQREYAKFGMKAIGGHRIELQQKPIRP